MVNRRSLLGKFILKALIECGKGRKTLAADLGVSVVFLSKLINDEAKVPKALQSKLYSWLKDHDVYEKIVETYVVIQNKTIDLSDLSEQHKFAVVQVVEILKSGTEEQKNNLCVLLENINQ